MTTNISKPSDNDQQGRIGVAMVALAIHKQLGFVFPEKPTGDIGIDGEVEIRNDSGQSHGRLIAVQIKCGPSYLKEQTAEAIKFRGNYEHLRYWSDFAIPVMLILCDPDYDKCYWQTIELRRVSFHEKGWSIDVPKANVLETAAGPELQKVAGRLQKKDFVELALRDWIGWRFTHRMRLASLLAQPRDYWWFSHLGVIGENFYMIDYTLADVDGFNPAELNKFIEAIEVNKRQYGYSNVIIAFISESIHHLRSVPEPPTIPGVHIEFASLLLELQDGPHLSELATNEALIVEYEMGVVDECFNEVTPARKTSNG